MTFRRNVRLDRGQVRDLRGRRPRAGGLAVGGGLGGVLLLVALVVITGGDLGDLLGAGAPVTDTGGGSSLAECETGADANEQQDCRILGYVNSVQAYWTDAFAAAGDSYIEADTVLFSGGVDTSCGSATSAVGPFYCPLDQTIYIDLGFFDELQTRFGAQGGSLAEGYVIAHEYGHHVQNLRGLLEAGRDAGAEGNAVRTELQADCFAGAWAGNAVETGYLQPLTQEQINQALDAASVIGDDRIQEQTQGQVNPETWTHGSSEQRQEWFTTGLETADPASCDTFDADL